MKSTAVWISIARALRCSRARCKRPSTTPPQSFLSCSLQRFCRTILQANLQSPSWRSSPRTQKAASKLPLRVCCLERSEVRHTNHFPNASTDKRRSIRSCRQGARWLAKGPMRTLRFAVIVVCLVEVAALQATIFDTARRVVHDSQHLPVAGATVTLKAQDSEWAQVQKTNDSGEFEFSAVPIVNYTITVMQTWFQEHEQVFLVRSDSSPILH